MEAYHEHVQVVNRFVIGALIGSDPLLSVLRRELRRMSPGAKVSIEEVKGLLSDVLKRDLLEGDAAKDAAKQVKRAQGKALRKRAPKRSSADGDG